MPAEAIRINRRVLLQCSIGAPDLKQPFAQPQQNGALSAHCQFAAGSILHLQQKSGLTGRTAAIEPSVYGRSGPVTSPTGTADYGPSLWVRNRRNTSALADIRLVW